MDFTIRDARKDDAVGISQVIITALRETNAKDYPATVIAQVEKSFSSVAVQALMEQRNVFVALLDEELVGTASLDGAVVRSVFVAPTHQSKGIGRQLMAAIEKAAMDAGIPLLTVPSSVTAERFYSRLGFKSVRDSYHGEERTIIMERSLPV
jgi:predicted N-acetyltransferase YhbS